MLREQVVVVEGRSWTIRREHSFGGNPPGYVAVSHILYCPRCRTQWGAIFYPDDDDYWPRPQYCEGCGVKSEWQPVPGSILIEEGYGVIDESLLKALPEPLLRREFVLTLKAYTNGQITSGASRHR